MDDFSRKLPQDVIFEILRKLPTEALIHLRSVSKFFHCLISQPDFVKLHLSSIATHPSHHHYLHQKSMNSTKFHISYYDSLSFYPCKCFETPIKIYGKLRLMGSTRGVVCLSNFVNYFEDFESVGTSKVFLLNPFIEKLKIIPPLQGFDKSCSKFEYIAVGFGFDHVNVDFRVVNIVYDCFSDPFRAVAWVYGKGSGSWRRIGQDVPCIISQNRPENVFANGIVYWLAYNNKLSDCIMGFVVVEEAFKVIELPRNLWSEGLALKLFALPDEKSLAIFVSFPRDFYKVWRLWVMNDFGSWEEKYRLDLKRFFVPINILNDGKLIATLGHRMDPFLIDVEKNEVKDCVKDCGFPIGFTPSLAFIDT